jgi:hypothetical protein
MALNLSSRRVQSHQTVWCQTIVQRATIPCSWDAHFSTTDSLPILQWKQGTRDSRWIIPSIRGHVFCSFPALLLKQELESRMKQAALESKWKAVIPGLHALQQVEANFQGRRFFIS